MLKDPGYHSVRDDYPESVPRTTCARTRHPGRTRMTRCTDPEQHMTHSATPTVERRTDPPCALMLFLPLEPAFSCLPTGQTRSTRTFWTRWRDDIRAPSQVRLLTCTRFAQRNPEGVSPPPTKWPSPQPIKRPGSHSARGRAQREQGD